MPSSCLQIYNKIKIKNRDNRSISTTESMKRLHKKKHPHKSPICFMQLSLCFISERISADQQNQTDDFHVVQFGNESQKTSSVGFYASDSCYEAADVCQVGVMKTRSTCAEVTAGAVRSCTRWMCFVSVQIPCQEELVLFAWRRQVFPSAYGPALHKPRGRKVCF